MVAIFSFTFMLTIVQLGEIMAIHWGNLGPRHVHIRAKSAFGCEGLG